MKRRRHPRIGNKSFGVFLQARLGSTRLREKVLLPLGGRTVVEQAMLSLNRCGADVSVLLTDQESRERLRPLASRCGFDLYVGPSDDVLARYAGALQRFPVDTVVRATADNPLVSSELVASLLALHSRSRADFSGYLGMPLGLGVEIVAGTALLVEDREATDSFEREHVNPFLYRRPERFAIFHPQVPTGFHLPDRSVTLDTEEDYRYLCDLYEDLYCGHPIGIERIIDWLRDHPRNEDYGSYRPEHESALRSIG